MELSNKAKMLGFALHARGVSKENVFAILMTLGLDDEFEDMMWFMNENPQAPQEQLVAVALQLDKESREKGLKK